MAPKAKNFSGSGRESKYSKSTANGFGGEGVVQMVTSSAMISQGGISRNNKEKVIFNITQQDNEILTILILNLTFIFPC